MIYKLADGKYLNIEKATKQPLLASLTYLNYCADKTQIEKQQIRNANL